MQQQLHFIVNDLVPHQKGFDPNPEYSHLPAYTGVEHNKVLGLLSQFVGRFGAVKQMSRDHGIIYRVIAQVNDEFIEQIDEVHMDGFAFEMVYCGLLGNA